MKKGRKSGWLTAAFPQSSGLSGADRSRSGSGGERWGGKWPTGKRRLRRGLPAKRRRLPAGRRCFSPATGCWRPFPAVRIRWRCCTGCAPNARREGWPAWRRRTCITGCAGKRPTATRRLSAAFAKSAVCRCISAARMSARGRRKPARALRRQAGGCAMRFLTKSPGRKGMTASRRRIP